MARDQKIFDLIDQEKMVDIMFDISVLEAMKSQTTLVLETNKINPNTYVYKKHHIDSLQFANSDKYYASDVKKYKEIFDAVNKRIEEQKTKINKTHKEILTTKLDQIQEAAEEIAVDKVECYQYYNCKEFIKESNNKNLHYIVPSKGEIIDLNKVYDTKFWWRTID